MKALFDPLVLHKIPTRIRHPTFSPTDGRITTITPKKPLKKRSRSWWRHCRTQLYDERVAMLTPEVQADQKARKDRTPAPPRSPMIISPVLRIDPSKIKEVMPPAELARYATLLKQQEALGEPRNFRRIGPLKKILADCRKKLYLDDQRPDQPEPTILSLPDSPSARGMDFHEGRREGFP